VRLFAAFLLCTGVACAVLASCGTVDPGPDVQPPAGCNAPPAFFVTDVWPKFFEAYGCGKSDCHDVTSGHGYFRLRPVDGIAAPDPASPISAWPEAWRANLMAVQANVSCSSPTSSPVLLIGSGRGQPHPPGNVVTDIAAADQLFATWLQGP
jgi:hypothetical protein